MWRVSILVYLLAAMGACSRALSNFVAALRENGERSNICLFGAEWPTDDGKTIVFPQQGWSRTLVTCSYWAYAACRQDVWHVLISTLSFVCISVCHDRYIGVSVAHTKWGCRGMVRKLAVIQRCLCSTTTNGSS